MSKLSRDKVYIVSDFHLGYWDGEDSLLHEKRIINWFDSIADEAKAIYLIGDIFDVWFEYKEVIPKGFLRFWGKLAEMSDNNIELFFLAGNHDMWVIDYFEKELKATHYQNEMEVEVFGKKIFLHHGDGIGKSSRGYKWAKKMYRSKFFQWLFRYLLHPDLGIKLARKFSIMSRDKVIRYQFSDQNNKEIISNFCKDKLKEKFYDLFVFGHLHSVHDVKLNDKSRYINLGEWMYNGGSYVVIHKSGEIELVESEG